MHPIDTRYLRHLLMLARHRNFRKAADALFITQPALTKSIKNLEEQLGVLLFDRKPLSVDPTPQCRVVLEHAQKVMHELEEIQHSLDSLSQELRGELRVGSGPVIARGPVADAVARLLAAHPALSVQITIDSWAGLQRQLQSGEIHLMVADVGSFVDSDELEILPLAPVRGVTLCRRGHPLLAKGFVETKDLLQYPLALPFLPQRWIEWLRNNAPEDTDPDFFLARACRVQCESFTLLQNVVLYSDFITSAPRAVVHDALQRGDLVELGFAGFDDIQVLPGVVYLKNTTLPPSGVALIKRLQDANNQGNGDPLNPS